MLFRRGLLILGAGALVAGLALIALWLKAPSPVEQAGSQRPTVTVLAATRALPAGALLRAEDMHWLTLPADQVEPGAAQQGQVSPDTLRGTALRRAVAAGGVIETANLVHPDQPGFLPAVLRPGMRADTIPVGRESGAADVIAPGDHVDVILTQIFNNPSVGLLRRSVGETILQDLRVLAVDQDVGAKPSPPPAEPHAVGAKKGPQLPQSVTVELTPRQAQLLAVARRLGELQLTLRGVHEPAPGQWRPVAPPPPTWAGKALPALRQLEADLPIARNATGLPPRPGSAVEIVRGSKVEQRCFHARTGIAVNCGMIIPPAIRSRRTAARPEAGPRSPARGVPAS